ncbi:hypothetical protein ACOSQ4_004650 [Xanthoceras sorbifolium]
MKGERLARIELQAGSCGQKKKNTPEGECCEKKNKNNTTTATLDRGENQQSRKNQRHKIKGEPWRERERAWAAKKREKERLLREDMTLNDS